MDYIERAVEEGKWKATWLAIIFPMAMVLPNIFLDITETMPAWVAIVNLMLPLSLYYVLTTCFGNVGAVVLCALPFIALNAFQIVILYLFGESIIAIDMFTNVVTTTPGEAGELLAQLTIPLIFCIVVYVPILVWAICLVAKKRRSTIAFRRRWQKYAVGMSTFWLVVLAVGLISQGSPLQLRNLYPYNVCSNIVTASQRFKAAMNYPETSAHFTYNAFDGHHTQREIHLLVIGETSRADHWELGGYSRPTNPRLSKRNDVVFFDRAISQSNTTHKCVPMMLSPLTPQVFGDSISSVKSIITAFKEAGYKTAFFTTQPPNRSYTEYFASEADSVKFISASKYNDMVLSEMFKGLLADTTAVKQFVILHTYGSHFCYLDRYPSEFSHFRPDDATNATPANKTQLINAYDNTIRYTDSLLADLIEMLEADNSVATLTYVSDHGEDIFDDDRERFLHASPTPTYYQLHVPMVVWLSADYRNLYPEKYEKIERNKHRLVAPPENVFHTIVDLAGLLTPFYVPDKSVSSECFVSPELVFLNDYNESVPLISSGIKDEDVFKFRNISAL